MELEWWCCKAFKNTSIDFNSLSRAAPLRCSLSQRDINVYTYFRSSYFRLDDASSFFFFFFFAALWVIYGLYTLVLYHTILALAVHQYNFLYKMRLRLYCLIHVWDATPRAVRYKQTSFFIYLCSGLSTISIKQRYRLAFFFQAFIYLHLCALFIHDLSLALK